MVVLFYTSKEKKFPMSKIPKALMEKINKSDYITIRTHIHATKIFKQNMTNWDKYLYHRIIIITSTSENAQKLYHRPKFNIPNR